LSIPETLYGPWSYEQATRPYPYDDTATYAMVGEWVSGWGLVEDWGCGTAWMRGFIDGPYRGVDGAWSRFADEVADLRTYRSDVPCAVMRHVLEHNRDWRKIADNFTDSWHTRAAVVLFIPPQPEDLDVGGPDWPVPDIAVSGPDLFEILGRHGTRFKVEQIFYPPENTIQWGYECVVLMER
jgi:hypothetical protein